MGGTGGAGGSPPLCQPVVGSVDYPSEAEQNNLKATANPVAMGTKGLTASVCPAGDVDIFSIDVTAGSSLTVAVTDGMAGCPLGAATYVRVFNDQNMLLGQDTMGGPGNCSLLTPASHPNLSSLTAGKYYVQVESLNIGVIPSYVVDIKASAPGCGDGVVQLAAGEQCDDNNNVAGDGCSPTCQIEGNYTTEVESNNTQDIANSVDGFGGAVAAIGAVGDVDFFSVTVTVPGSSIRAEVTDGFMSCPAGFDSKIYLFDPNKVQIAVDDDGGVNACSLITPATAGASNLQPGVYAIKVEEFGNNATVPFYVLKVQVFAPGCGDGIVQAGEQCDDGNNIDGDTCSSTCQFEGLGEVEPNNDFASCTPIPAGGANLFGSINPSGDADYYCFDVIDPGSSVSIETTNGPANTCPASADTKIYLYDQNNAQIAVDDDGGFNACSLISPATAGASNLQPGTYKIRVEDFGNNGTIPLYVLRVKVSSPGCGDGLLQAGEQCDDGNTTSGDGCNDMCMAEAPAELEPNGDTATATPQWPGFNHWIGSINPLADHDYFSFQLMAPGSVTLATHDVGNAAACGFDTVIHLLDGNGVQLVQDDDDGVGTCSLISPMLDAQASNLPAGTYYVWVQRYNDSSTIASYQLDLTVQ